MPTVDAAGPELVALIALVAGLTEAVKRLLFPDSWQFGRAPMLLAAFLAALAVAIGAVQGAGVSVDPLDLATAWLAIYTGAVGAHQTITKAGRIAAGTTNPTGPDDPPA